MSTFLNTEQEALAREIASLLIARGQTVAVAEATTGGLVSAALLWVAGASVYYKGGGVVYTLDSRVALAGAAPELFANYRGTTAEMIGAIAESMRQRLTRPGASPSPAWPAQRLAGQGCHPGARQSVLPGR